MAFITLLFAVFFFPFLILLMLGSILAKNKIVARLCRSFLCAITFFIIWAILVLFIIPEMLNVPGVWVASILYASIDCAAVYIICLIFIWGPFTVKRRRVVALGMAIALLAANVTVFAVNTYQNSVMEISGYETTNLHDYQPFIKDTLVKSLDEPSNLQLYSGLPRLDGATALYPLYSAFVRAVYPEDGNYSYSGYYNDKLNDAELPVLLCSGTSYAFDNLLAGDVDVVFLMGVSDEQQAQAENLGLSLQLTPIGSEAFVFLVNKNNTISNLTVQNVIDIYSGKVKNWKDVGGSNDKIRAYQRRKNSGSQTKLEQLMGDTPIMQAPAKDIYDTMSGLIEVVADYKNYKNSLGYSFRYYINDIIAEDLVKLLPINGIEPNVENIADGSYPFTDNFYAITVAGREGQTEEDIRRQDNARRLTEWILSPQGQSLVDKTGYVPLDGNY